MVLNKDFSIAEAIAIEEGKIIAVGSNKEINKFSDTDTKVIDAKGRTVIPGLIDAHCHPEHASFSELDGEIPDVHSVAELLSWIRYQVELKKKGRVDSF